MHTVFAGIWVRREVEAWWAWREGKVVKERTRLLHEKQGLGNFQVDSKQGKPDFQFPGK